VPPLPPFQPHPAGRRRAVELTPFLDASELAWSGALDGRADFEAWPWADWAQRDQDLCERRLCIEAVRALCLVTRVESPTRVRLDLNFALLDTLTPDRSRRQWSQVFRLESTRCSFGGRRWWFRCPSCERLRARLYRPRWGEWECRECGGLTYRTRQEENRDSRHGRGMRAIRRTWDLQEVATQRSDRRNLRRRISRWRWAVRRDGAVVSARPIQVTGNPSCGHRRMLTVS